MGFLEIIDENQNTNTKSLYKENVVCNVSSVCERVVSRKLLFIRKNIQAAALRRV